MHHLNRIVVLLLLICAQVLLQNRSQATPSLQEQEPLVASLQEAYNQLDLHNLICFDAFETAIKGYNRVSKKREGILTLIDFSKPSTAERLAVVDLNNKKVLYKSLVAHGKGSGGLYATLFSNRNGSHQSSLGFYRTSNTYQGSNGYSLRLEGLEPGINDNAMARAIVIHGASYCSKSIAARGRLGRSFGCPALPHELNKPIIDAIKEGSLLFIYARGYTSKLV